MSYDICFLKRKKINEDDIYELLEGDASPDDEHFISKAAMLQIRDSLKAEGLKFKVFERDDEDYLELNFESYQLSMFNSQIALSLPYWDVNSSNDIMQEVKTIANLLLDLGFTGFDPQTETFIYQKYDYNPAFHESKKLVDSRIQRKDLPNFDD
jgi:hypothetical protein